MCPDLFLYVLSSRNQIGWMVGVPQRLEIGCALAHVLTIGDLARKRAGDIERAVDSRVQPEADIERAFQIDRRREGPHALQLHRAALSGEKDDRFTQFSQVAFNLTPIE